MKIQSVAWPVVLASAGAALADGPLSVWGSNEAGQCNLPGNLGVVRAAFGGALYDWGSRGYSVALRPDGSVAVWGSNAGGHFAVPLDARDVVQISVSALQSLALRRDGRVVIVSGRVVGPG